MKKSTYHRLASWVLLLAMSAAPALAQVPAPAEPQEKPIILLGVTAHIGNGEVIENAVIAFEDGKITMAGPASDAENMDLSGYEQIQAEGKHVYPGFILPNTELGLVEIGAVRATVDNEEEGVLNPNVRSIISYNTDSELIPTFRFNGILVAQITPVGGMVSGSSSVVHLDAWNWEDAAMLTDDAMHINWPGRKRTEFDYSTYTANRVPNEKYEEQVQTLENLFSDGAAYAEIRERGEPNLKLEATKGLFDGSKALHIHADEAKEIIEAVKFAQSHKVQRIVLVGGYEAYLITDFLKENEIPVIIDNLHDLPQLSGDDVDQQFKLPALLHQEGIMVSLGYNDAVNRSRNLPFIAGTAAAYGVDKEDALMMITSNTAKILGIDDKVGTLEKDKQATLFVSEGDALDMRTNIVAHAFIDGRKITLPAMQQRLYEKYKEKYSGAE
ncbi:amidohydrolase family protein [Catalinimonas niigatensis]|uniref:amidohydrolase family protein n=1 Tax=Catalinimonas niigatensis TaxID=1397264 RepID=UPI0026655DEA|nr:amidohydrolase family protein [Catalinimonas niigatensis]WPP52393.1 amidohydrolase family protein [Catalinimonas niigatensis]